MWEYVQKRLEAALCTRHTVVEVGDVACLLGISCLVTFWSVLGLPKSVPQFTAVVIH